MNASLPQAELDPRPIGWFAVALSDELRAGQTLRCELATQTITLRRKSDGQVELNGSTTRVTERNGVVHAWHHPTEAAPTFAIPDWNDGLYTDFLFHQMVVSSHPQEIFENSIDTAHFPIIHGYRDIAIETPMRCFDHRLTVGYKITRTVPVLAELSPSFEVNLHGIGCAHTTICVEKLGLKLRMQSLATPTSAGKVHIRVGVAVEKCSGLRHAMAPLILRVMRQSIVDDFNQDVAIWENKQYLARPVLAKDDGPVGHFRRWCRQFYFTSRTAESGEFERYEVLQ